MEKTLFLSKPRNYNIHHYFADRALDFVKKLTMFEVSSTAPAGEFADQNVRLVTVNLEESPKKITSTLERLKLPVTVALDQDGVAAGRYAATAIPQTVIIDREGKVARLFVGGGSHFEDQLRNSLKELLTEKASEEAAKQQ